MNNEFDYDVAIIGAGTAGMSAYREARKATDRIALIEGGPFGTTCARVGCMPSKLLIAAAEAAHGITKAAEFGIYAPPAVIDGEAVMQRVKRERDRFVGFVTEAVKGFDPKHLIEDTAAFVDDHTLALSSGKQITAKAIVIATGSSPNIPEAFKVAGHRLIVNDDVFEWDTLPDSVAVFGIGVVGLELGQALHRLGVRVRMFGRDHMIGPLSDPAVKAVATDIIGSEVPAHFHATTEIEAFADGVLVKWQDSMSEGEERFDYLLAATGRRPNLAALDLDKTSLPLDEHGLPQFDPHSLQAGDSHIFLAGDVNNQEPLLHVAANEGRISGQNAARFPEVYGLQPQAGLSVVFSDPQICIAGRSYQELERCGFQIAVGEVSFADQGRARVIGENAGLLRVYGDKATNQILGAEMIGPAAEHIGHLLAWAVQSRQTVEEMLKNPFYHPVLEEGVRTALRNLNNALGAGPKPPASCIDCGPGG